MDPKIQFGVDFFCASVLLSSHASSMEYFRVIDQAAYFFLTLWDFNREEIEKVSSIYNAQFIDNSKLNENLHKKALFRLIDHLKKQSKEIQLKFIKQFAALSYFDFEVTEGQEWFMDIFMKEFDLRPSDFYAAANQGNVIAIHLYILSGAYAKESVKNKGEEYLNWLLSED
jgi:hypothetical protein